MNPRIIADITNFIFVSDEPEQADAIFLPGGSFPEPPEYAAQLYHRGCAEWLIPSGGVSVKRDKWPGVRRKAELYSGDYQSDCEFFTDVLLKNGVPASAIIRENKSGHTRECHCQNRFSFCRLLIFSKNTFLFYHISGGMGMGKLIFWGRIV